MAVSGESLNNGEMNTDCYGTAIFVEHVIELDAENTGILIRKKMDELVGNLRFGDQTEVIDAYLIEINQLQDTIRNCHFIVKSLANNPELQQIHAEETLPLIEVYNRLITDLKETLLDHFEWEEQEREPKTFRYWKLYYELEKEELFY